jgi:hypothetical protein
MDMKQNKKKCERATKHEKLFPFYSFILLILVESYFHCFVSLKAFLHFFPSALFTFFDADLMEMLFQIFFCFDGEQNKELKSLQSVGVEVNERMHIVIWFSF